MVAFLPLIVALLGFVILAFEPSKPWVKELGEALLWCGILVALLIHGGRWIKVL